MSFHIVCDSCTDLTEEDLKKGCYTLVPLTLLVDGEEKSFCYRDVITGDVKINYL